MTTIRERRIYEQGKEQGKLEERKRIKQWVNSYTRRKDFDIEWFIGGLKSQISKEGEKR